MNLKVNNFLGFNNFEINMSYPKKIVNSPIDHEYLSGRQNFRYKKINIVMGSNATGKTSLGKMMMKIFNFINTMNYEELIKIIKDKNKEANFSIDIIIENNKNMEYSLYRIDTTIKPNEDHKYDSSDILVLVKSTKINKDDSYEKCVEKLNTSCDETSNYVQELEKVRKSLGWRFEHLETGIHFDFKEIDETCLKIINATLKTLDPAIESVERISEVKDTYVIKMKNQDIIIQDGKILNEEILSSGTKSGINIAFMVAAIKSGRNGFYYCDEKFSYINTDIEQAFLAVMCELLKENEQLFFTTHNLDILAMDFPKHSFVFLRKDISNEEYPIQIEYASHYLKRNTDSLRNAVENDMFATAPSLEGIYKIVEDTKPKNNYGESETEKKLFDI